ncbi:hypothetical protein, partial [Enterococcus faecium]
ACIYSSGRYTVILFIEGVDSRHRKTHNALIDLTKMFAAGIKLDYQPIAGSRFGQVLSIEHHGLQAKTKDKDYFT